MNISRNYVNLQCVKHNHTGNKKKSSRHESSRQIKYMFILANEAAVFHPDSQTDTGHQMFKFRVVNPSGFVSFKVKKVITTKICFHIQFKE